MTDDELRSRLFSDIIRKREDRAQRQIIDDFSDELNFEPIGEFMISQSAWDHVLSLGVVPKVVFAHPKILFAHPTTSFHYRGMALLPRKRVTSDLRGVSMENATFLQPRHNPALDHFLGHMTDPVAKHAVKRDPLCGQYVAIAIFQRQSDDPSMIDEIMVL